MNKTFLPKPLHLILISGILLVLISACTSPTPATTLAPTSAATKTPLPAETSSPTSLAPYPAANQSGYPADQSGYPVPGSQDGSSSEAVVGPLPTSSSGGTVTGFMLTGNPPGPIAQYPLYLGKILLLSTGEEGMVSMNRVSSPRAVWGAEGEFVFINVPAGRYSFVLDMVVNTVVLKDPQSGKDFIIEVKEGETIDLGKLIFSDLQPEG